MIGLFITIFVFAWKLTLILVGLVIAVMFLLSLANGVLRVLEAIMDTSFRYFGIEASQDRQKRKQWEKSQFGRELTEADYKKAKKASDKWDGLMAELMKGSKYYGKDQ